MSGDPESTIKLLKAGLSLERTSVFLQADALLVFELAWVYLAQHRYEDAAKMLTTSNAPYTVRINPITSQ
jgi:hypothetical protein